MVDEGVTGAEFIAANTDATEQYKAETGDSVGTQRLVCGRRTTWRLVVSCWKSEETLTEAYCGADMVFNTAGMGRYRNWSRSAIARIAKDLGVLFTAGVVTRPSVLKKQA